MTKAIIYLSTLHKEEKEVNYKIKEMTKNIQMVWPDMNLVFVKHEHNDQNGIEIIGDEKNGTSER